MGRKKRGNVLFARRVPPEKVGELLAVLKADRVAAEGEGEAGSALNAQVLAKVAEHNPFINSQAKPMESNWVGGADMYGNQRVEPNGFLPVDHELVVLPESEMASQIKALLDDVERLTKELEEARSAIPPSDNELVNLWKAKALTAEALVRKYEQERYG